jgi:SAM-dependent methyltransferase
VSVKVGSAPFLWVMPLAVYLSTFIVSFAPRFRNSLSRLNMWVPDGLLAVFPLAATTVVAPPGLNWVLIGAHLLLLWAGALLCHTRLAQTRPAPEHLTEFYFWIALGGVLGGVFTAILAPNLFATVLEYPLLVLAVPFFRVSKVSRADFFTPVLIGAAMVAAWAILRWTRLDSNTEAAAFVHTALVFAAYKLKDQTPRFALAFAVLMIGYTLILPGYFEAGDRVHAARNFFGVKSVIDEPESRLRKLLHGDTIHGIESTDPDKAGQPLSYYYPGGAVSDVIQAMRGRAVPQRFGVLGLGAGTMASYADADHHITFFEIDPAVESIARRYFSFVHRCGPDCNVVLGDGRFQLSHEPSSAFDLLLLDAFSSDSVPTHLVSREALQMYLEKLKPHGLLLFHVSNRYLDIEKLVGALVADAGLIAYSRFDDAADLRELGKASAHYVVAARGAEDFSGLSHQGAWHQVAVSTDFQAWSDDYSSLLGLIRLR